MSSETSTLSLNTEQHHHHFSNNAVTVKEASMNDTINNNSMNTSTTATPSAKELSKLILRTALQKANIAVQCDSTNNVLGAITAYKEAVNLLERVLITADNEGDRQRLQNIHDSYSERIVLLSALTTARLPQQQQRSSPVATSQNNNTVYSTNNESSPSDTTVSNPSRLVSHYAQKEKMTTTATIVKNPSSLPPAQLIVSKSTPTSTTATTVAALVNIAQQQQAQPNTSGHERKPSLTNEMKSTVSSEKEDQKASKGKSDRPSRFSSRLRSGSISMPAKEQQQTSNKSCDRSSSCSIDSSISIDNTQQQLQKAQTSTMILPSFVQSNSSSSTTKKVVSTLFRSTTRNSSLHLKKSPSSTSTSSTSTSPYVTTHHNDSLSPATIPIAANKSSSTTPTATMQRSSSMSTVYASTNDPSSQPYSPQMIINRPSTLFNSNGTSSIYQYPMSNTRNSSCSSTTSTTNTSATVLSRPSLNSGLGSMRRKAANRLSMDGLMGKNKSSNNYQTFLKDHIEQDDMTVTNNYQHIPSATPTSATSPTSTHSTDISQSPSNQSVTSSVTASSTASSTINNHPTMAATTAMTPIAKNASYSQQYLKLLLAIERSMSEGAYLTQKLYIPKNLWQQPNIRLSSMDIKISACESIMNDMARLENWIYLDDLTSSIRIIQQLETTVDQLQTTLAKKLKRESTPTSDNSSQQQQFNYTQQENDQANSSSMGDSMSTSNTTTTTNDNGSSNSNKKTQSFISWGSKITKSVERMNGAFSLTGSNKAEDQFKNYIEVLQKLFAKLHVLEYWLNHYCAEKQNLATSASSPLPLPPQYDILIMKLIKICSVLNNMIGGFVLRDITILLAKWLKRGSSWVNE